MSTTATPVDTANVTCAVCLQEIPDSEAGIIESNDTLLYFCGSACYHQWRGSQQPSRPTVDRADQ